MNIDLISQVCIYCDYPIWRAWIKKYRSKFNKVILYPSRHHGIVDLEKFWKGVFPETWVIPEPIDWTTPGIDWRQVETEPCIELSNADWMWFSEADFFTRDWNKLFSDIENASKYSDAIGIWNPTHFPYIHPSCFLLKREMYEKTTKDFRAHSEIPGGDHYSMLTQDIKNLGGKIKTLQDMGYKEWEDMFHLGGLTYVYQNFKEDFSNPIGVKRPEVFEIYNKMQRLAPVEQNQDFINLIYKVEEQLKKMNLSVDPEKSYWEDFFKV